jgi:hypothetical protein
MTNFTTIVDLIQVFANEYIKPGDTVLVLFPEFNFKPIFDFINCESFLVGNKHLPFLDITINDVLPFDDHIFDIIISFKNLDIKRFLKKEGKCLISSEHGDWKCLNYSFKCLNYSF